MVLHFLFEAFYLVYPVLFRTATFPLKILSLLEPVFNLAGSAYSPWINTLLMAVLPALGTAFSLQMLQKLSNWRHSTSFRYSILAWLRVFVTVFIMTVVIFSLAYFFPSTVFFNYPNGLYIFAPFIALGIIGIGSLFFYFFDFTIRIIFKRIEYLQQQPVARGIFLLFLMGLGIYPFFLMMMTMTELFIDPLGNPQASRFFIVNAAIKNTCFIDPERANCPQSLEEIRFIEPSAYTDLINGNQVIYTYDSNQNLYTLIVRYAPLQAVIFDWRLVEQYTIDFHDYEVNILGKDRLVDPPAHLGEVTFPEWQYLK